MSGVRVYNASKVRELLAAANDDTLGMPPSATARSRGGRSDGGGAGGGAGSGAAPISTRSRVSVWVGCVCAVLCCYWKRCNV